MLRVKDVEVVRVSSTTTQQLDDESVIINISLIAPWVWWGYIDDLDVWLYFIWHIE